MSSRLAQAARNAEANAVVDLIDAQGSGSPGKLKIYTGSRPATPNTAPGGGNTLLATLTFSHPAFGDAGAAGGNQPGVAVASAITAGTAGNSGDAAWFRVEDGSGNPVWDGTIKESGQSGDAEMVMDEVTVLAGGSVSISSLSYNAIEACA